MLRRALLCCLLSSCSRTPSQNPTPPAPSASVSASTSAAALPGDLPIGDGCHAGTSLVGTPLEVLTRVQKACAPDGVVLRAPKEETGTVSFRVNDAGACLRIVALGEQSTNLTLVLRDASGIELASDTLPGAIALIAERGPICVPSAGEYRLELGTRASVGIWRAP